MNAGLTTVSWVTFECDVRCTHGQQPATASCKKVTLSVNDYDIEE